MKKSTLFTVLTLLALLVQGAISRADDPQLSQGLGKIVLDQGDTLVFLGDSITHQCLYTQYVEDFFYTRYPSKRIRFHNSGVSGDRASDALARFDADVARYKPKYVTILLGMNDGRYTRFEQEIFDTYEKDMGTLLDRLEEIGATAVPMTPTMFDSRAVELNPRKKPSELRDQYYNGVLAFYGAWLRQQSLSRGLGFVDMYSPLNAISTEQRKTDSRFTLIEDSVHPDAPGQVVMAFAILNDMHVNRQVSSINAVLRRDKWVVTAQKGEVSDVLTGDRIGFTFTAQSLPWVLPEEAAVGYKLTKSGHKMSNERLRVSGLAPGRYQLLIDGQQVGVYSDSQLGFKIELQENAKTPQHQQAFEVATLNKQRNDEAVRPLRNLWRTEKGWLRKLSSTTDADQLAKQQAEYQKWQVTFKLKIAGVESLAKQFEDKIYLAAKPQPRRYELVRVKK